jgi:membrane protein YqaA with SNARE-associated domain
VGKKKEDAVPFQSRWKEIALSLLLLVILWVLGAMYWRQILDFVRQVPFMETLYQMASAEIDRRSILGLSIATLFGSLFFVGYPPEMFFVIYSRLGYPFLYLALVMTFWMVVGQILNYALGYYLEKKVVYHLIKENNAEFKSSLKKYDAVFIVVINIVPLPADVFSLFLGMIRYDFKKLLIYTSIGRALKLLTIWLLILLLRGVWSP